MSNKLKFQHEFRLGPEHKDYKSGSIPSLTVPDETLTVKQIMQKHVRGQRIAEEMMKTPVFDDQADFDSHDLSKVEGMDLFEREELMEANKQKIADLKEKEKLFLEKQKKQKKAAEADRSSDQQGSAGDGPSSRARKLSENDDEADAKQKRPRNDQKNRAEDEAGNSTTLS